MSAICQKSRHHFHCALHLDNSANTKRTALASLAENFDIFQFAGPVLNLARLFVHKLQCDQNLGWDTKLRMPQLSEWRRIANQVNSSQPIIIDRFVGSRNGEYKLIAFRDASKVMTGVVIYIQDINTKKVSFLIAKNRLVNN